MKLLIAGGGTGGHIFSGLAIAEEWISRGGDALFVGTKGGMETKLVPANGFSLRVIPVSRFKGIGFIAKIGTLLKMPLALVRSFFIIRETLPDAVVGIGGYASGPIALVAWMMGLKMAILDQNSIPGFTNRILGRFAKRIFLSFEGSIHSFNPKKVRIFGNPVIRRRIPAEGGLKGRGLSILVCGGSQGAQPLNGLLIQILGRLKRRFPSMKIFFQTGRADLMEARDSLHQWEIDGEVAEFFDDLERIYSQVSLVIARAGAGTLTELALWGLPSILIPYPYSADGHQLMNARLFEKAGAGVVIEQGELTQEKLFESVQAILQDGSRLSQMSKGALRLARPDAAKRIVDELWDRGA